MEISEGNFLNAEEARKLSVINFRQKMLDDNPEFAQAVIDVYEKYIIPAISRGDFSTVLVNNQAISYYTYLEFYKSIKVFLESLGYEVSEDFMTDSIKISWLHENTK